MGAWSLLLATGITLIFIGLYTHWSIALIGALLPFLPVLSALIRRRQRNTRQR